MNSVDFRIVIPPCVAEDISGRIRLAECSVCIAGKNCRFSASWLIKTSAATSTAKPTSAFRTNSLSPASATPAAAAPPRRPPKAKPDGLSPASRPSLRCCPKGPCGATSAGFSLSASSLHLSFAGTFCQIPAFASRPADCPPRRPPCGSPQSSPGRSLPARTFCLRRRSFRSRWSPPPVLRSLPRNRPPPCSPCLHWRRPLARPPRNFAPPPGPTIAASSS